MEQHRIWTEGEGLTWSTITEVLGQDENTPTRLQKLTLDLTDQLFEELEIYKMKESELAEMKDRIDFLKGNLGSCLEFGRKRLKYEGMVKYVHDKRPVTVSLEIKDGKIEVKEELLTIYNLNVPA